MYIRFYTTNTAELFLPELRLDRALKSFILIMIFNIMHSGKDAGSSADRKISLIPSP